MGNLHTKSGENNCEWNMNGKCTKGFFDGEPVRKWDSKLNCTVTQYGAQKVCSNYKLER